MAGKISAPFAADSSLRSRNFNSNSSSTPEISILSDDFPPLLALSSPNPSFSVGAVNGEECVIPPYSSSHLVVEVVAAAALKPTDANPSSRSDSGSKDQSWSNVLFKSKDAAVGKESGASIKLDYVDSHQIDGVSSAVFDSGELKTHILNCDAYVVGYFVGRRPSFPVVKNFVTSLWKTRGDFSMTLFGHQAFFFNFVLEEDRVRALELGSVNIEGKLFLIRPWSPFLEQKVGALSSVPIWMNITGVPIHLWNDLGFSRIASIVGKPIMTDSQTAMKSRMSYARICVEVDANCSYPSVLPFYIDNVKFEARAEYPWKPKACAHCKRFGHTVSKCSFNPPKAIWVPKAPDFLAKEGAPLQQPSQSIETPSTVEEPALLGVGSPGMRDSTGLPNVEQWQTYSKRNKNNMMKKGSLETPVCNVNPFAALDEGSQEVGNEVPNEEGNVSKDADLTSVGEDSSSRALTCNPTSEDKDSEKDLELVLIGNSGELDAEGSELEEEEMDGNLKSLEDIPSRVPMTKELHIERLNNFAAQLGVIFVCDEKGKNTIFNDLADKYQKSRKQRELEKLGVKSDISNDQLGRGLRNSAKKK